MRNVAIVLSLAMALPWLFPIHLHACGDKYLRLASRLGPDYHAEHPADVLIYMPVGSVMPKVARELSLQGVLHRSGHRVDVIEREADLATVLNRKRYDIVIADGFADANVVAAVQRGVGKPTLLPAFSEQSHRLMEKTGHMPLCLINSGKFSYHVSAEIDHVMDVRKAAVVVP